MHIPLNVKRSPFYEELQKGNFLNYFDLKHKKYIPTIDNLYFNVYILNDSNNAHKDGAIADFLHALVLHREYALTGNQPVLFDHDLYVKPAGVKGYPFCLTESDLYDIFVCTVLRNDNTPRIQVQLRALGLWTRGLDEILLDAYNRLSMLLREYGLKIEKCMECRIDYAYHTNAITGPDKVFRETNGKVKNLHTSLKYYTNRADLESVEDGTILLKNYILLGSRNSKSILARFYNKSKEVLEKGYKDFFFKLWYDNGLISFYDKWCYEYVMLRKSKRHNAMSYLPEARLAFYVEYGTDPVRRLEYKKILQSCSTTIKQFKQLADEFMPDVTVVVNIEFQTQRKYYYNHDSFIDSLKPDPARKDFPFQLQRICKILDYRRLFTEHLTTDIVAFYKEKDPDGNPLYLDWWKRLQRVDPGGLKTDEKLLREYSGNMDKKIVQRRIITALASAAVYDDNLETGFVEDISDLLSDLNDNQSRELGRFLYLDESCGIPILFEPDEIYGSLIIDYPTLKLKKEALLKNRRKSAKQQEEP